MKGRIIMGTFLGFLGAILNAIIKVAIIAVAAGAGLFIGKKIRDLKDGNKAKAEKEKGE